MKTRILGLLFAALIVSGLNAQIKVVSPNGGERFPNNGQITLIWNTDIPLQVGPVLERYEGDTVVEGLGFTRVAGYATGKGSETFGEWSFRAPIKPGKYKLHVIGVAEDNRTYEDWSDDYFYITGPATATIQPIDFDDWVIGHTKKFRLSWSGLAVGDPYAVSLLLASDYVGEGYGFFLKIGTIPSESGTIDFDAPFPTESTSLFPQYFVSHPKDGYFIAEFADLKNYVRSYSYPINVVMREVQVYGIELKDVGGMVHDSFLALGLSVDAKYSHTDLTDLTLPIILASKGPAQFQCALYDKDSRQVSEVAIVTTVDAGYGRIKLSTHGFTVKKGERKSLELRVTAMRAVPFCVFRVDPDTACVGSGPKRDPITVAGRAYWGAGITVTDRK